MSLGLEDLRNRRSLNKAKQARHTSESSQIPVKSSIVRPWSDSSPIKDPVSRQQKSRRYPIDTSASMSQDSLFFNFTLAPFADDYRSTLTPLLKLHRHLSHFETQLTRRISQMISAGKLFCCP